MQYLKQQSKVEDKDGKKTLTAEEAQKAASKTKKKFAVFTSITPREVGGKWVYDWTGSKDTLKTDFKTDGDDSVNGQLLDGFSIKPKNDLQITETRKGKEVLGYKAKNNGSKQKFEGIIVGESENSYIRDVKQSSDFSGQFNLLKDKSIEERRKIIKGSFDSERVALRKEIVYEIWKKAKYNEKLGQFIDSRVGPIPNLDPPQYFPKGHPHEGKRKPRADIGHIPGQEWKKRLSEHKKAGHTREQIIEIENDASLYVIEERSYNRSHKGELK